MRLLVIHQNFPGQFGRMVKAWAQRPGWDVRGIGRDTAPGLPGFDKLIRYRLARKGSEQQHPYLRQMEAATLHGQAVARVLLRLKQGGFTPDAILAHPGWGETLYAKDVFPDARLIHLCEWFYNADGADLGFDPEFPLTFDDRARVRTWNALHTLNLSHCDVAIAPTHWQRSRHPDIFLPRIVVQHEGLPVTEIAPDPAASLRTPNGTVLKAGDPVITYVARNLEPYRGFHIFLRALARIQKVHSTCHAVIVGADGVSYGRRPPSGKSWREHMLGEVPLDPARTHFMGRLPRPDYLRVLQISAAHVYLTYPFVLSWSLIEAMACGTPIIGSDTAPVREVIRDGQNGRLAGFFDTQGLTDAALAMLEEPGAQMLLRMQARRDAQAFDQSAGLAGYDQLCGTSLPSLDRPHLGAPVGDGADPPMAHRPEKRVPQ